VNLQSLFVKWKVSLDIKDSSFFINGSKEPLFLRVWNDETQ